MPRYVAPVGPERETLDAGGNLAVEMADALSGCGDPRGALAHLEAVGRRAPLTIDAERQRARLEARLRAEGSPTPWSPARPPLGLD